MKYFEVTHLSCEISHAGVSGSVEHTETRRYENCLNDLPRKIYPSGTFTPKDDNNHLLPIAPQPPAR